MCGHITSVLVKAGRRYENPNVCPYDEATSNLNYWATFLAPTPYFSETGSLTDPGLYLARITGQQYQGFSCLCFNSIKITDVCHQAHLYICMDAGYQTNLYMFTDKHTLLTEPSPQYQV